MVFGASQRQGARTWFSIRGESVDVSVRGVSSASAGSRGTKTFAGLATQTAACCGSAMVGRTAYITIDTNYFVVKHFWAFVSFQVFSVPVHVCECGAWSASPHQDYFFIEPDDFLFFSSSNVASL